MQISLNSKAFTLSAGLAAALACLTFAAPTAIAESKIQAPSLRGLRHAVRNPKIRRARQFVRKEAVASPALSGVNLTTPAGRRTLAEVHVTERAMHYVAMAREQGHEVNFSYRTLRGRNTANAESTVARTEAEKLFIEVTPETFGLFQKIMGQNMIWPSGDSNAGHLYTLMSDQAGGEGIQSVTYGTSARAADCSVGKLAAGILLTDKQMSRMVKYTNAGLKHGESKVFGYKMRNGSFADMACTNWLSGAPIGDVKQRSVAPDRLLMTERWTKRPKDLAGRKSLSHELGLSRAQHPGIWMGRLVLAEQVPVLAVFSGSPGATNVAEMSWGLGQVGELQADGNVTGGAQ